MRYDMHNGAFSATHYPQYVESKSSTAPTIIFNGEIYNFLEIKTELLSLGYTFSTHSDTEVILASYLARWEDCVKKFNGMRVFAIYDPTEEKIFLSRDILGEKPLYYYYEDNQLIRWSELKTILQHEIEKTIDPDAIDFYMTMWYIPAPWSVYKKIKKLPANHNMSFSIKKQHMSTYSYYEKPSYEPIFDRSRLIQEWKSLVESSVQYRMFADVPVGAFLSGGLDSSTVVAEMTKTTQKENLHTFSIGFEGKYDETYFVNIVKNALWTNHHHAYFTQKDFEDRLDDLYYYYDEPFGDYSNFPTSFVCELARQHVTVSLSGDGGDEIFGWYMMHQVAAQMSLLYPLPRWLKKLAFYLIPKTSNNLSIFSKMKEAFRVSLLPKEDFYAEIGGSSIVKPEVYKQWSREKLRELLTINHDNFTQAIIDFDLYYNTLADNFLTKVDRASMRVALEGRPPFLDKRLIAYVHTIPTKWKVTWRKTKIIMRDIIKDIVPKEIRNRGKKWFQPPIDKWILQDIYSAQLQTWLQELVKVWILNETWEKFYTQHALQKSNSLFNAYKIKLLLLIKWYGKRPHNS